MMNVMTSRSMISMAEMHLLHLKPWFLHVSLVIVGNIEMYQRVADNCILAAFRFVFR